MPFLWHSAHGKRLTLLTWVLYRPSKVHAILYDIPFFGIFSWAVLDALAVTDGGTGTIAATGTTPHYSTAALLVPVLSNTFFFVVWLQHAQQ